MFVGLMRNVQNCTEFHPGGMRFRLAQIHSIKTNGLPIFLHNERIKKLMQKQSMHDNAVPTLEWHSLYVTNAQSLAACAMPQCGFTTLAS